MVCHLRFQLEGDGYVAMIRLFENSSPLFGLITFPPPLAICPIESHTGLGS